MLSLLCFEVILMIWLRCLNCIAFPKKLTWVVLFHVSRYTLGFTKSFVTNPKSSSAVMQWLTSRNSTSIVCSLVQEHFTWTTVHRSKNAWQPRFKIGIIFPNKTVGNMLSDFVIQRFFFWNYEMSPKGETNNICFMELTSNITSAAFTRFRLKTKKNNS